jgi:hypothetical protein
LLQLHERLHLTRKILRGSADTRRYGKTSG